MIDEVAAEVEAVGRRGLAVTADAGDSAAVEELVRRTVRELGRLDVMCNHAGQSSAPRNPLIELSDEDWDETIRIGLYSVFYGTRAAARAMVAQGGGGSIVNTSSITSVAVMPGHMIGYSTAKAAVNHFTRYMAWELSPYGIRVNAVVPGAFDMVADRRPDLVEWLEPNTPIKRWSRPDDVTPAVLYLASDASSYVTGETLRVSGGSFLLG